MSLIRPWLRAGCAGLLGLHGVACSSGAAPAAAGNDGTFIAFSADFQGFHEWQSFDVTKDAADAGFGTAHPDAMLIEYLNHPPASGSSAFPVGTIIVKEGTDGDPATRTFFAMVKRGGGFNAGGATGWEWFDLSNTSNGGVTINWRGFGPPAGETYGGDANAGCNTCHVACGNDSVCAKAVQLDQF